MLDGMTRLFRITLLAVSGLASLFTISVEAQRTPDGVGTRDPNPTNPPHRIAPFARRIPGMFQGHQPIPDTPYFQEVGRTVAVPDPVVAVAGFQGDFWLATTKRLWRLDGTSLVPVAGNLPPVRRLVVLGKALWAVSDGALHRTTGEGWTRIPLPGVQDVTSFRAEPVAAAGEQLWRIRGLDGRLLDGAVPPVHRGADDAGSGPAADGPHPEPRAGCEALCRVSPSCGSMNRGALNAVTVSVTG